MAQDSGKYSYAIKKNGIRLNANEPLIVATGGVVTLPSTTTIGGSSVSALGVITSASANALTVGRQGTTNPAFNVDASAATSLTGLNLATAGTGAGFAVSVVESGGTNNALTIDAMGSGLMTLNGTGTGNVKVGHGLTGSTQALSGAGAVNLTTVTTKVTSTGANALTLADGVDGQIKIILMVVDGGDATLTPSTKTGYSTIVFNDAGDGVTLVFTTTQGWICVGNNGATIS